MKLRKLTREEALVQIQPWGGNGKRVYASVKDLGNVNVGRSCIRFKKLGDLNLPTLKKVIKAAEKSPGLVGVGAQK